MWGLLWSEGGRVGCRDPAKQLERSEQPLKRWHKQELCERRRNILRRRDVFFYDPGSSPSKHNVPELSGYQVLLWKSRACFLTLEPLRSWLRSWLFSQRVCVTRWISTSQKGTTKFKVRRFITRTSIRLAGWPSVVMKNYRMLYERCDARTGPSIYCSHGVYTRKSSSSIDVQPIWHL